MANTSTGRIYKICETNSRLSNDGSKTFTDRDIWLDCTQTDQFTGERGRTNIPVFNFAGEKCKLLDVFNVGDVVTISFSLNGIVYEKEGEEKSFTKVQGYAIEAYQSRVANQQSSGLQPLSPVAAPMQSQPKSGLSWDNEDAF